MSTTNDAPQSNHRPVVTWSWGRGLMAAMVSGLLLAASWPVDGLALLIFVGFVPLLWAEHAIRRSPQGAKAPRVFAVALLAFMVWNALATGWIGYSTVTGTIFVVMLTALLMATVMVGHHLMARRLPYRIHLLFVIALWLSFEDFQLGWPLSWPWLTLGHAFADHTQWVQWYEYTGAFGGSLWVWIVNVEIWKTLERHRSTRDLRALRRGLAKSALLVVVPIAVSYAMLSDEQTGEDEVNVVVLQPNVDPYTEKHSTPNADIATRLFALADEGRRPQTDFIIAPETAFAKPVRLDRFDGSAVRSDVEGYIDQGAPVHFLSGIALIEWIHDEQMITRESNRRDDSTWYNIYNSAFLLDSTGRTQLYHKSKLVVGVEKFPFKAVLEPLMGSVVRELGGSIATRTTQRERGVFSSSDHRFRVAPVICYESIYGEFVAGFVKNKANFLAIITNDGWWRDSAGHRQHLSYARLRAIETRRSIARSANTGTSALINPRGELISTLPYGTEGALAGAIPLNDTVTFYVQYGDYIAHLALYTVGILVLLPFVYRTRRTRRVVIGRLGEQSARGAPPRSDGVEDDLNGQTSPRSHDRVDPAAAAPPRR